MKYRTIVADPPWHYDETPPRLLAHGRQVRNRLPYPTMTVQEIAALPVEELGAESCRLFLWATDRYLPSAFGVMEAWHFGYRQTLVWHKRDAHPMSGSLAPVAEFLLVGTRGKPELIGRLPNAVMSHAVKPLRHSEKPEMWLDYVEQVSPGPYLELFARRNRLGWDTWGNEALEHVELIP